MKLKAFSVYDNATKLYAQPFYMVTKGAAMRAFEQACKDPTTQMAKSPQDFYLFEVGEYDDETATHENTVPPTSLCHALEFKENYVTATQEIQASL